MTLISLNEARSCLADFAHLRLQRGGPRQKEITAGVLRTQMGLHSNGDKLQAGQMIQRHVADGVVKLTGMSRIRTAADSTEMLTPVRTFRAIIRLIQ